MDLPVKTAEDPATPVELDEERKQREFRMYEQFAQSFRQRTDEVAG